MDSMTAWAIGRATKHKEPMVFDWDEAARLIVQHKAREASAGLEGDWEYTGGSILMDGKPVPKEDTYTYLSSTWAKPELLINGQYFYCYRMASEVPGWDAVTHWPESALAILNAAEEQGLS